MNYDQLIAKAVKGRTINSLAKEWGVPQKTLDNYVKGVRMPDFHTTVIIVKESGLDAEQVLKIMALHEGERKVTKRNLDVVADNLQPSFDSLLRIANAFWT